jgi:hypothetical protein
MTWCCLLLFTGGWCLFRGFKPFLLVAHLFLTHRFFPPSPFRTFVSSCYRFKSTAVLFYLHAIVSSCYRFKSTAVLFYLHAIAHSYYRIFVLSIQKHGRAFLPACYRTFVLSYLRAIDSKARPCFSTCMLSHIRTIALSLISPFSPLLNSSLIILNKYAELIGISTNFHFPECPAVPFIQG